MQIVWALILLSGVVLFHEFGHYLLAKMNHITVLEFALGMGPKIFSFEKNGTVYAWRLLPFGGSCMMLDEDGDETGGEAVPGSFLHASPLRRISVVAAGPVFNFILAFILSAIIIGIVGIDHPTVQKVPSNSPAAEAGLRKGDRIIRYEGNGIANARELLTDIQMDGVPTDQIEMTVKRGSMRRKIIYQPKTENRYLYGFTHQENDDGEVEIIRVENHSPIQKAGVEAGDILTAVNGQKIKNEKALSEYWSKYPADGSKTKLTFKRKGQEFTVSVVPKKQKIAELGFELSAARKKTGFLGVLAGGFQEVGYWIHVTVKSLAGLVKGLFSINEMSGPVGIVSTIGSAYKEARQVSILDAVLTLLNLAVLLSANLGVMNLLPFPALDGGRLVFLVVEAVRGKPVNRKAEGWVHFLGFAALMILIVMVSFNDIRKLFL